MKAHIKNGNQTPSIDRRRWRLTLFWAAQKSRAKGCPRVYVKRASVWEWVKFNIELREAAKNRYTLSVWGQKQVHTKMGVFPKTGTSYTWFGAKNSYILKPSTNHTPGALRLASVTSYLFLAWKGQVHLVLSTLSSFQLFLANFEPIRGHTSVPDTYHRRLTVQWTDIPLRSHLSRQSPKRTCQGLRPNTTRIYNTRSRHILHDVRIGCCLLKWYG